MAVSKILGRFSVLTTFVIIFYVGEMVSGTPLHMEQRDPNSLNDTNTMVLPPPNAFIPLTREERLKTVATTKLPQKKNDSLDESKLNTTLNVTVDIPRSNVSIIGRKNITGVEVRLAGPFGFEPDPTTEDPTISTTTEMTPMSFPVRGIGRTHNMPCETYGSQVHRLQTSGTPVANNQKADSFSKDICRINQRLECVPTVGKELTTTDATAVVTPAPVVVPGATTLAPPPKKGFCRCHRGLSDRAIYLNAMRRRDEFGIFASGCYIPAGFAHSSLCGHEVALPYGLINNGTLIRRTVGNTATMCVPNAECRIGYKFTGLRCVCLKTAIWNPRDGTCMIVEGGHQLTPLPFLIVVLFIFVHIYCN